VTSDQGISQVEWRPLDSDDSLGSVTVEHADGTTEDRGPMSKADTARLALQIFGGSATRISVRGRIVKWIEQGFG